MKKGFANRQTDRQTDRQIDIGDRRITFATEKLEMLDPYFFFNFRW